jgi:two-component system chemotaxis response regulator CheB
LIVQHMPPVFTNSLASRLDRRSGMQVREAVEGDAPAPGEALVAPGGWHMTLGLDGRLHLDQEPPIHGVRPAVDRTLHSLAAHWRGPLLAVILTGMGTDGVDGAVAIRAKGATVYAQDEETSIVYGMPRAIVDRGAAAAVLPLDGVARAIAEWAQTHANTGTPAGTRASRLTGVGA